MQGLATMFGADRLRLCGHGPRVLSHGELIAALEQLKEDGRTTNAELSRVLNIPSSRIAEVFTGKRRISVDEMKVLVEHFKLEQAARPPAPETLESLLDALIPLAPPGRMTDRSLRALAEAMSYGLELLGANPAKPATSDALMVAARAAAARFREKATAA